MTLRLLAMAFRNLLRAKRRNALAGGSMALGTAALVLASGLADGITRQLSDNLVAIQTGHLQVVVRPDDFAAQNNPFDAYGQDRLPDARALARRIEESELRVLQALVDIVMKDRKFWADLAGLVQNALADSRTGGGWAAQELGKVQTVAREISRRAAG